MLSQLFGSKFMHFTSVYFSPSLVRLMKNISPRISKFMSKRSHPQLQGANVSVFPGVEIQKNIWQYRKQPVDYFKINLDFQKDVIKNVAPPQVCISFDGSSDLIFEQWKGKSKLVLDLAIGVPQYRVKIDYGDRYEKRLLDEKEPHIQRMYRIYEKELELADIILCGSQFVKRSVEFIDPEYSKKCRICAYGANLDEYGYEERQFKTGTKLKFVFSGGRVGFRKGADVLIEVWKDLIDIYPECELHFFGTIDNEIDVINVPPNIFFHGRVMKNDVIAQLKEMDIYVFPSTFEGLSLAVLEAMAMQFPIITTFNATDILQHGDTAEIVEAGNRPMLLKAMIKLIEDRDYRIKIAKAAYALAPHYTWDNYKHKLEAILQDEGINTTD